MDGGKRGEFTLCNVYIYIYYKRIHLCICLDGTQSYRVKRIIRNYFPLISKLHTKYIFHFWLNTRHRTVVFQLQWVKIKKNNPRGSSIHFRKYPLNVFIAKYTKFIFFFSSWRRLKCYFETNKRRLKRR